MVKVQVNIRNPMEVTLIIPKPIIKKLIMVNNNKLLIKYSFIIYR